jgi:hypothetical protein
MAGSALFPAVYGGKAAGYLHINIVSGVTVIT